MWSTLIGLIERWWREKPRLDTVRAIVNLRDTMRQCAEAYRHYIEARSSMSLSADEEITFDLLQSKRGWFESIERLSAGVSKLSDMLEIFSPELNQSLFHFRAGELRMSSHTLDGEVDVVGHATSLDAIALFDSYQDALGQLDDFIRKTFKPEEVLAVQRSSLR